MALASGVSVVLSFVAAILVGGLLGWSIAGVALGFGMAVGEHVIRTGRL